MPQTTAKQAHRHASRVAAVRELVATRTMTTSHEIVAALEDRYGIAADRSTVSRDLDEIGAVMVVEAGGQGAYRLPQDFSHDEVAPLILVAHSVPRASAMVARLRETAAAQAVASLV